MLELVSNYSNSSGDNYLDSSACWCHPVGRLISLKQLMIEFEVGILATFITFLQNKTTQWRTLEAVRPSTVGGLAALTSPSTDDRYLNNTDQADLDEHITALMEICREAKFYAALTVLRTTKHWLSQGHCLYSAAISELQHVLDSLEHELDTNRFFMLSGDGKKFFGRNFGKTVSDAFPSASTDVLEAGNCLALDRSTAAVFHLMRAVEWGMRALCAHLGFARLKSRKGGKVRFTPVSHAEWEAMLNELHIRVDAKMNRLSRGKEKQTTQEFYYPILQDLRGFRDAWRVHTMHTRRDYTFKDAEAIYGHVRRFMVQLSTRVKEC